MKPVLLLLALPLLLTACDTEVRNPAPGDENVALSADAEGRVKFDLPFAKGDVKLPAAMMDSSDFEIDGVKLPAGSKLTGFNLKAGEGNQARIDMAFNAPTPPAEVSRYFLDEFKAKGMQAALADGAIRGTTKDGSAFTMRLAPQGGGTNGTIDIMTAK